VAQFDRGDWHCAEVQGPGPQGPAPLPCPAAGRPAGDESRPPTGSGGKIDPLRIGILAFRRAGHLSATASTNFDRQCLSDRRCKPIRSVAVPISRFWSTHAYLTADKKSPGPLAAEIRVTSQTPPTFFVHARRRPHQPRTASGVFGVNIGRKFPPSTTCTPGVGTALACVQRERQFDLDRPLRTVDAQPRPGEVVPMPMWKPIADRLFRRGEVWRTDTPDREGFYYLGLMLAIFGLALVRRSIWCWCLPG